MASGAILATCWVCEEVVWEDEWYLFKDSIIHEECLARAIKETTKLSTEQYNKLCRAKEIEQEIEDLKTDLKDTFKYYHDQVSRLEKELEKIKERE